MRSISKESHAVNQLVQQEVNKKITQSLRKIDKKLTFVKTTTNEILQNEIKMK